MARSWTTERLVLRQIAPDESEAVRAYGLRSREFHSPWDPVRPADFWERGVVSRRLVHELETAASDAGLVLYLSTTDEPSRVIGRIAFHNVVRGFSQSCTVGYGLAPEATGKGFMSEALGAAVDRIAFGEMGLHRVEAAVIPRNTRSLRVVERCGFEREGYSPRFLKIAGVWEDHVRFARINPVAEQG